jgi:leucyl aminopeptidase
VARAERAREVAVHARDLPAVALELKDARAVSPQGFPRAKKPSEEILEGFDGEGLRAARTSRPPRGRARRAHCLPCSAGAGRRSRDRLALRTHWDSIAPAMEIELAQAPPEGVEADVLAFTVGEPVTLPQPARELDRRLEGRLSRLVEDGELKGERGSVTLLHSDGLVAARRIVAVGLGEDSGDADSLRTAAAAAATRTGDVGGESVAWILEPGGPLPLAEQARAVVDGTAIGPYEAGRWKTNGESTALERLVLCGEGGEDVAEEARRAGVIAEWTNRCRDLVNAPPNELTPARLAEWAEETAGEVALRFEALGPDEIESAGMGAFAAVAQGSRNTARLITLRHEPEGAGGSVVLGLVGKAITFDAGGLSLKPAKGMDDMKSDMAGGAAVLAALGAIAQLGLPLRVLAVVPACENMPGGRAYRPGDIITASNGKTIEVTNTDAEGRLILADALWHAREAGATHLLDLATLTGAMVIAMGDFYAGLFANDEGWLGEIRAAAETSGDHAWPFPLHDTYGRYIESTFADMKNSSDLRQASPILAARFLQEFVGDGPWAHLDIAGTAYLERGRGDYYTRRGATGYGVRLLAELARRLSH